MYSTCKHEPKLLEPEVAISTFASDRNHLGFKFGFICELGVGLSWDLVCVGVTTGWVAQGIG
eukprot:15328772-Ditylum_brightwellii.AAC.1